jgi:hypothetical protein
MRFAAMGRSRAACMLLAGFLAFLATSTTTEAATGCNDVAIQAMSTPRKSVRAGATVRLSYKVKNPASVSVVGDFQIVLPPGATLFKSATASPMKVAGYNKTIAAEYVLDYT